MAQGPLQLFRRRTLRGLAGFVVACLLAGHALAASGLCVITSPDAPATTHEASAGCDEHMPVEPGTGVKHHCPADEPSPQTRSVDLPASQAVAAIDATPFQWTAVATRASTAWVDRDVPLPSLYARLQRLLL